MAEGKLYHARVVAVPNQRKQRIEVGERDAIADGCLPIADWLTGFPLNHGLIFEQAQHTLFHYNNFWNYRGANPVNQGLCGSLANYYGLHRQI